MTEQTPHEQTKRERMFEAELLHNQLEQLQGYLAKLDSQKAEVLGLKEALDKFGSVQDGEEILVPLASGVFIRAKATGDKQLRVNVGQGTVVTKTAEGVHTMLDEQMHEMTAYEDELRKQFDQLLGKLNAIQKEFKES